MKLEDKLRMIMQRAVDDGELSGCSALICRRDGASWYAACGVADMVSGRPVERDTIFRMYSQAKPVTAVALTMLIDRGLLDAGDPVEKWLPGFRGQRVLGPDGPVPPSTPVAVMHLMSMTSGLVYPDADPAGQAMGALFARNEDDIDRGGGMTTLAFANEMGKIPLAFQPGERFRYGVSADVAGALVEAVDGRPFDRFLREEIFEPLGMRDTDFFVPPEKRGRLAEAYQLQDGRLTRYQTHHLCIRDYSGMPPFASGGAGLFSTLDDYALFGEMLLDRGVFRGRRLLSERAVDWMTRPQVDTTGWAYLCGYGYGKFMSVCTDPGKTPGFSSLGEYGWGGWLGTNFVNMPRERMTVLFCQNTNGARDTAWRKIRNAALAEV